MGEEIWTLIRRLTLSFSFSTLSWRSFQAAPMAVLSLEEVLCLSQRVSTVQNMLIMVDGGLRRKGIFSRERKSFSTSLEGGSVLFPTKEKNYLKRKTIFILRINWCWIRIVQGNFRLPGSFTYHPALT